MSTIASIWGRFSRDLHSSAVPLDAFVREILRLSRTSCSTLQTALLYCVRCSGAVDACAGNTMRAPRCVIPSLPPLHPDVHGPRTVSPLQCGRRMFLAAIMVASKFLQDRTYSNRAWSRISGLCPRELENLERVFLRTIQFNLVVDPAEWRWWIDDALPARIARHGPVVQGLQSIGLRRATSENVLGQELPYDASLASRSRIGRLSRHGSIGCGDPPRQYLIG